MQEKLILGIRLKKHSTQGIQLQNLLTKYGCVIKTRLGLNETEEDHVVQQGIILLELSGDRSECQRLENELLNMDEIEVQKMLFE